MKLIHLDVDSSAFDDVRKTLSTVKGGFETAARLSINEALAAGKTTLSKEVRVVYTPSAEFVKDTIRLRKASKSDLSGALISTGYTSSLRHFAHTPKGKATTGADRKQIRVSVKKSGGKKPLATGFAWDGGKGTDKYSLYVRTGEKHIATKGRHKGKRVERLKKATGPSVPQMVNNDMVRESVEQRIGEVLENRLQHHTLRLLEGAEK